MPRTLLMLVAAVVLAAGPVLAQEEPADAAPQTAPAAAPDPLLEQIGSTMDDMARRNATQGENTADLRDAPPLAPNMIQGLLALGFVIALILIAYWALRRWGKGVPMLAGAHLGKVLGRVYLDRGTALHFVQVGDKVLLVGVNPNAVSLLGEFSSAVFNSQTAAPSTGGATTAAAAVPFNPDSFLAELRTRSAQFAQTERVPRAEEDEIASLRGDIQRLQRYLREENREHED